MLFNFKIIIKLSNYEALKIIDKESNLLYITYYKMLLLGIYDGKQRGDNEAEMLSNKHHGGNDHTEKKKVKQQPKQCSCPQHQSGSSRGC